MPLETPSIDDRTYDDLVEEIRARVCRYTDEWTDLNDSDPGVTFIQLFAWLADMLLYRLGKVPELNYIKFLELLGFQLKPDEPARTEITFPVRADYGAPYLIIPLHTQVEAAEADEEGPITFETDGAHYAIRAELSALQVDAGAAYTPVTEQNLDVEESFEPFGSAAAVDHALLLGFSEPLPRVDLDLAVFVAEEQQSAASFQCGLPKSASYPSATIVWEYWDGRRWSQTTLLKDDTLAFTRSGHVLLKPPPSDAMQPAVVGAEETSLFWLRARLTESAYESPPKLLAIRTNTVPATQAETIKDEIVGGSDGSPNMTLALAQTPVLAGSLVLEVDEGREEILAWREVSDLYGCGPDDRCYTLDRTGGTIRFGDGVEHGAIPLANPQNPSTNIVAREYRTGGGTRGNVQAGKLTSLLTSISGLNEDGITNLFAAHSGSDEETLEAAQVRARQSLKSRCRAVTAEDFETLAKECANIGRAKALPLWHPSFPEIGVPGVVTVIVVPQSEEPSPTPSEGTLRTVCEYLDQRRLLTTEVYVIKPTYRLVEVRGRVIAADNADLAEVFNDVEQALLRFLHPLTGGRDAAGWPFGGTIYYAQVLQHIADVSGVERVAQLSIFVDGKRQTDCQDVAIRPHELVYSTTHSQITVDYEMEDA